MKTENSHHRQLKERLCVCLENVSPELSVEGMHWELAYCICSVLKLVLLRNYNNYYIKCKHALIYQYCKHMHVIIFYTIQRVICQPLFTGHWFVLIANCVSGRVISQSRVSQVEL